MRNKILQGIIVGFIFTLLISSVCCVTYYGLDYVIGVGVVVWGINLLFIAISALIAALFKKLTNTNKIILISNILLSLFGILMIAGIFNKEIIKLITIDYMIPGPTIKIPNIIWLIILLCVTIGNSSTNNNPKHEILRYAIGQAISVVILSIIHDILFANIKTFNNALEVNNFINNVIQGICGVFIVIYFACMSKKCLNRDK